MVENFENVYVGVPDLVDRLVYSCSGKVSPVQSAKQWVGVNPSGLVPEVIESVPSGFKHWRQVGFIKGSDVSAAGLDAGAKLPSLSRLCKEHPDLSVYQDFFFIDFDKDKVSYEDLLPLMGEFNNYFRNCVIYFSGGKGYHIRFYHRELSGSYNVLRAFNKWLAVRFRVLFAGLFDLEFLDEKVENDPFRLTKVVGSGSTRVVFYPNSGAEHVFDPFVLFDEWKELSMPRVSCGDEFRCTVVESDAIVSVCHDLGFVHDDRFRGCCPVVDHDTNNRTTFMILGSDLARCFGCDCVSYSLSDLVSIARERDCLSVKSKGLLSVAVSQPDGFYVRDGMVFRDKPGGKDDSVPVMILDGVIKSFVYYDTPLSNLVDEDIYSITLVRNGVVDEFKGSMSSIISGIVDSTWDNGRLGDFSTRFYLKRFLHHYRINGLLRVVRVPDEPGFFLVSSVDGVGNRVNGDYGVGNSKLISNIDLGKPSEVELDGAIDCFLRLRLLYKTPSLMDIQLKWCLLAPFSFIFKQLHGEFFFPTLIKLGPPDTFKSTSTGDLLNLYGDCGIGRFMWSGVNLKTDAKLDRVFVQNTFPSVISEVEKFLKTDIGENLISGVLKSNELVLRENIKSDGSGEVMKTFLALSSLIMDGNDYMVLDKAQLKRIIKIETSDGDVLSPESRDEHFKNKKLLNLVELKFLFNDFCHFMFSNHKDNDYNDWISIIDNYFDSIGLDIPKGEPEDLTIESRSKIISEEKQMTLSDLDNRHYDIIKTMVQIARLPKYRDIRPRKDSYGKEIDDFVEYDSKLMIGLENEAFDGFSIKTGKLKIINFSKIEDEADYWKRNGFINLKTVYDILRKNHIKCEYKTSSFRGHKALCVIIDDINDIRPDF